MNQGAGRAVEDPAARRWRNPLLATLAVTGGLWLGVLAICTLICVIGGRITPAFTRNALLRLFEMLGDDPAIRRYRARMFTLLH